MGPPAKAMRSLGDKIASSIVAQSAGVPTLEWNGTGWKRHSLYSILYKLHAGLTIPNCSQSDVARGKIVQVPADVYDKGCVHNQEEAIKVKMMFVISQTLSGSLVWSLGHYAIICWLIILHM